jgi:polysaccharide export outer membrane protein
MRIRLSHPVALRLAQLVSRWGMGTLFLTTMLTSCGPTRNLVYLGDVQTQPDSLKINNRAPLRMQPGDLLGVTVNTFSPESDALFNLGRAAALSAAVGSAAGTEGTGAPGGYLVDERGAIDFPELGTVQVGGLTKAEAEQRLSGLIEKDFVKKALVTIRLLNFKVTVIGEVGRPTSLLIPNEQITLLEAIGLAGDLTAFGRRENVLLIRERNGVRSTVRVDLTNKNLLQSPYYYLRQNDIVYVEPDRAKGLQASSRTTNLPLTMGIITTTVSTTALIISLFIRQ